ncbi:MAG: threonylcarbamoyl-AMP synthase [Deltaproteobacteria bacterium]|jgi:tRNA threonylcarbamoyl adenosine modification protein (Sua5/YciO/YrdC/YwlC family)|nr:threonylcarbamoyl-AMP synthase [Deltaproteobacteria bacterium]MBW2535088.1 threonylcarbamoyl-AMP synthase [Deltaproteobacteria bacterium]
MLLPINPLHPEPRKIRRAVDFVENGGVIGYPTDTVYGLGCDLMNKHAIDRLRQIKGVNAKKRLAFICPDLSDIAKYAIVDNATYRVLKHFLPGPYCFVLQASREVPKIVQTKQKTVGIRVPDHPVTQALVRELGRPIISTTAKRPGDDEPLTDPWEIADSFPALDLVLGVDAGGIEPATVVDLSNGDVEVLREGAGPVDDLI